MARITRPRLAHAIMALRPNARPGVDFICRDDGDGPYLIEGSMANPPTQAEVDAVTEAQLDAAQRSKVPVDPRDAKIAALEARIEGLEKRNAR